MGGKTSGHSEQLQLSSHQWPKQSAGALCLQGQMEKGKGRGSLRGFLLK